MLRCAVRVWGNLSKSNKSRFVSKVANHTGVAWLVQALRFTYRVLDRFAESLGSAGAALQLHVAPAV